MFGAHRRTVQREESAALEDAIDDGKCEIVIMEHAAPSGERFVGGEDHRSAAFMAIVDDVEEHVRGIGAVRQIPHLVDDQDGRMRVGLQRLRQLTVAKGRGEVVNERGRRREEGIEAVLDRAVGHRDGQVRLSTSRFPKEISDRPSVTKSGVSAEPSMWSRSEDW